MSHQSEIRLALEEQRYDEAFRLCQSVKKKEGHPMVLFYGACALFGLGHIRQAEKWVEDHARLLPRSVLQLYLRAYLHLHRNEFDRALLCYTSILELDPSDTFADSLIERMKSGEGTLHKELTRSGAFLRFIPLRALLEREDHREEHLHAESSPGKDRFPFLAILYLMMGLVAIGISVYVIPDLFGKWNFKKLDLPETPASGTVIPPVEFVDAKPRFVYQNRDEAIEDYNRARESIRSGYVNRARLLLGKIELSNSSFEIKERASLLRDFIPLVELAEFRDPLSPDEVADEPFLYRGAQVKWQGRIVSVETDQKKKALFLFVPGNTSRKVVIHPGTGLERLPAKGNEAIVFGIFDGLDDAKQIQLRLLKWELLD